MTTQPITHLVLGPAPSGKTVIISRHSSEEGAKKALARAKGFPGFRVESLREFFA